MELNTLRARKIIKNGLPGFADGDLPAYLSNGVGGIGMKTNDLTWYNTPVSTSPYVPQWQASPEFYKAAPQIQMQPADGVAPNADAFFQPKSPQELQSAQPQLRPTTAVKSAGAPLAYDKIGGALLSTAGAVGDVVDAHQYNKSVDQLLNEGGNRGATAAGQGYTWQNDPEYQRELAEVRKSNTSNILKAAGSGAAAGAAVGSIIPGIGTPIGGVVGGALGAIGGLFGGASRSRKARERLRQAEINAMVRNDFNRDDALTRAIREQNAREIGNPFAATYKYANGKTPIFGPPGYANGYYNSKVSSGETIGNLEEGWAYRIPGKPNNKDTRRAFLRENDFVLTNKDGISALANLTGDYVGALNLQNMRNSYKNGKLPRFSEGVIKPWTNIVPHVFGGLTSMYQYFDAKNQDIHRVNTNRQNEYRQPAFELLASLKGNQYPTLGQLRAVEARTKNAIDSSGGLGADQKLLARIAQQGITQNQWANALAEGQRYDNTLKSSLADAWLKYGESAANRTSSTAQYDNEYYAKAHAAIDKKMWDGIMNFNKNFQSFAKNEVDRQRLNATFNLYQQQQALDMDKYKNDLARYNADSARTTTNIIKDYNKWLNAYLASQGFRV